MTEKEKKGYEIVLKGLRRDFPFIKKLISKQDGRWIYAYCDYDALCKFKGEEIDAEIKRFVMERGNIIDFKPSLTPTQEWNVAILGNIMMSMPPEEYIERREYLTHFPVPIFTYDTNR